MELFGFEVTKKKEVAEQQAAIESFTPKQHDDGATVVYEGGAYGTYVDLEGSVRSEAELITRYREMSLQPEVESAVDDIVNDFISYDCNEDLVSIVLDDVKGYSDTLKTRITQEFEEVLKLLDFNNAAYDIIKRWYVDGRLYYHLIIDEKAPQQGLLEIRYIDPRKIRKVREVKRTKQKSGMATLIREKGEFYVYNERGFGSKDLNNAGYQSAQGVRIAKDSVLYVTSGLMDSTNSMVLSYLHKAIKPLNQLRAMEDASVIYRLSRAPERRIFYIDVGNLPKVKAEQYLRDMMVKHKNKLIYDASTGEIRDDRKFMTMLEDFWLPRREGGKGTEITTLPGGQNLDQIEDINYFLKRFYKALGVPSSRLESETGFNLGRASEITRDELKFNKFIDRLRMRFAQLLKRALEKQLVLRKVISEEEAVDLFNKIRFDFKRDNFFTELKEIEVNRERFALMRDGADLIGRFYSEEWAAKNILRMTDEQYAEEQTKIQAKAMEQNDAANASAAMPDGGQDFADGQETGTAPQTAAKRRDPLGTTPRAAGG